MTDNEKYIKKTEVEEAVCRLFNVSITDVVSRNRCAIPTLARGFIIFILHKDYKLTTYELADEYFRTRRDICWHIAKVKHLISLSPPYKEMYDKICKKRE